MVKYWTHSYRQAWPTGSIRLENSDADRQRILMRTVTRYRRRPDLATDGYPTATLGPKRNVLPKAPARHRRRVLPLEGRQIFRHPSLWLFWLGITHWKQKMKTPFLPPPPAPQTRLCAAIHLVCSVLCTKTKPIYLKFAFVVSKYDYSRKIFLSNLTNINRIPFYLF